MWVGKYKTLVRLKYWFRYQTLLKVFICIMYITLVNKCGLDTISALKYLKGKSAQGEYDDKY